MPNTLRIYYDSLQEGTWFQCLHPRLSKATLLAFPPATSTTSQMRRALKYDRPDIILTQGEDPILVIERTIEVPSGHNVGQRFARLAAAAQLRVPLVYFGPYAAYKHGGATQGPRYMNLRLFHALRSLADIENSAISIINWPVDRKYEIIRSASKDARMRSYMTLFFDLYNKHGLPGMVQPLRASKFSHEQELERQDFISREVKKPEQYDEPPASVRIGRRESIPELKQAAPAGILTGEIVFYDVGMRYIRSDPYTGMALLYAYLYCGGMEKRNRRLILHFPHISIAKWKTAARGARERKDVRIFREASDGILFSDGFLAKAAL